MERAPRGNGPVTLRDVAADAGVHPATASRALNPGTRALVNEETAQRVLASAERLGYRPNPIARGLKTNRSYTIGVVVPDLRNPLFPPIARGVEERLEPSGYTSLLANTDNDHEREKLSFEALRARQVDGVITGTARRHHPLLRELCDTGLPVVQVNRRMDDEDIPSVVADDAGGIELALDHLVELGHRRIAHVAGSLEVSTGQQRFDSFLRAMHDRGVPVDEQMIPTALNYSEAEGYRLSKALLEGGRPFTAILAGNDLMALGCIDAINEAGLTCPGDVSVVGFNDMDWSARFTPPLTTVRVPHYELGVRAADLLLERLATDEPGPAKHLVLPVEMVVRGSTAPVTDGSATTGLTRRRVAD